MGSTESLRSRSSRARWFAATVVLALGLVGCSPSVVRGYLRPGVTIADVRSVAVLPFDNTSGTPDAGKKVLNLLLTELTQTRLFEIADVGEVEGVLRRLRVRTAAELDRERMKALGEELRVKVVLVGSVDEYEVRKDRDRIVPVVAISARILDVKTGRILWTASHAHDGDDWETVFGFGRILSLSQLAQIVVSEMVESLTEGVQAATILAAENRME